MNVTQLVRAPDEADCCNFRKNDIKNQENVAEENLHPSVQAKVQDLDISQLSRDFAQDFSQMPDPGKLSNIAKDNPRNGFSPSACLSAMKQANQKARQANLHHDCDGVSNRRSVSTTNQNNLINEGTISDSGFQSAVADITHVTASSFVLPSSENKGQSQQWSGFKSDIHRTTAFPSTNKRTGKAHLDGNFQEVETDVKLPNAVKESKTVSPVKERALNVEDTSAQLPSSAKGTVDKINWIPPNGQVHGSLPEKAAVSLPSVLASGFKTASHKGIQISSTNLDRAKRLFEETEGGKTVSDQPIKSTRGTEGEPAMSHGSVKNLTCNSNQLLSSSEKFVDNRFHLTASQKADVTDLCILLEEADSQFEFTQFKSAKLKQHCQDNATSPPKADKALDPDFFTGIDFDDSFSSDAEKHLAITVMHDKMTVVSGKTSNIKKEKSSTEDVSKHISEGRSSIMSAETQNLDRVDHTETSKLENKDPLMLGVGFTTAGGNVLRVSKKCLSKARALFADLEDNLVTSEKSTTKQSSGTDAKTQHECSVDNHTGNLLHFKEEIGKCVTLDRRVPGNKDGTESLKNIKMDTTKCQSGFQMASGKEISVSAKAIQEADAFFKDCDTIDANTSMSVKHKERIEPLSGSLSRKTNLQKCKNVQGIRVKFSEEPISEFENKNAGPAACHTEVVQHNMEIDNFGLKNTVALRNSAIFGNSSSAPKALSSPLTCTTSKCTGSSAVNELSNGGGFCTASGEKVLVSTDVLKKADCLWNDMYSFEDTNKHLANQISVSPSKNGGFQTASGKGLSISSAALRKAKSLFSYCDEVEDLKQTHSKMPVPGLPSRNHGFLAASGKAAAFSSEALQKAKALFSDISFCAEIPAVSYTRNGDKKQDDAENMGKTHCGFSTAGGAKVCVSQKNLLKAKNLLKEFDPGSFSAKEMQEADSSFKDCDVMDGKDDMSVRHRKNIPPVSGCDGGKKYPPKFKQDQRMTLMEKPSPYTTSKNIGCSSVSELSNSGGFHTASGKKVSVSNDAMTKAKSLLNETATFEGANKQLKHKVDTLPPQNGGFHTASGRGVTISSAALKKAKTLLSECEGVDDKIGVKPTPSKAPVPGPVHRNHGFVAASGKQVAFSSEALQKAKSLFGDISFNAEIPAVSDRRDSEHKDAVNDTEKMHCGFTTAGGAKVHVSQKNLLKAKNVLKDLADEECYDSSSYSTSPHDTHKSDLSKVKQTASDKDIPTERSAPRVVTFVTSLHANNHDSETLQNSSECASKKEKFKAGKNTPSGVSHLHDSLEEEMSSVLEYEMNQTSSSEVLNVKKSEESSVLHFKSLNLTETQQRFLAQEALDCTKALLEDDNLAGQSLSMTLENILLHDNPKSSDGCAEDQKGKGKRLVEEPDMTGK